MPLNDPRAGSPSLESSFAVYLFFALAVGAVSVVLAFQSVPEVLGGALVDTDSYMWLVRVRRLMETGAWYDPSIPRSNAPWGETLHWTRPLDVLLLLGTWALTPFVGTERALHLAGVFVSPLLLIVLCVTMAWAARPLLGKDLHLLAMIALLAQPAVVGYALPGRPDHHPVILIAFAAALGFSTRSLLSNRAGVRDAFLAGLASGAGLWVSTEFLLPLAVLLVAFAAGWLFRGPEMVGRNLALGAGLVVGLTGALVLERPPSDWLAVEYDRVSVVHLYIGVLVVLFWSAVRVLERRTGLSEGLRGRAGTALLGGPVTLLLLGAVFPRFFGGPMVDVDPVMKETWLVAVTELQAALLPRDRSSLGWFLAYLGPVFVAVPYLVWRALRPGRETWTVWLPYALGLLVFFPMGVLQFRWVTYVELLSAPLLAGAIGLGLARVDRSFRGFGKRLARVGVMAAGLTGFLFLGGALLDAEPAEALGEARTTCSVRGMISTLAALERSPLTVAAHLDFGPELLYRTPHHVLATPYHRNDEGVLGARRLVNATDPEEARAIVAERGVDVIVLCPSYDEGFFVRRVDGRATLYGRLLAGSPPPWLEAVETPAEGLHVYRVVPSASGP